MPNNHKTEKILRAVNLLFADEITPNLPKDKVEIASMILKGLEIAIRYSRINEGSKECLPKYSFNNRIPDAELDDIANKIRNGNFDDELLGPIFEYLEKEVSSRLLKSNPDFVTDKKFSQFTAG